MKDRDLGKGIGIGVCGLGICAAAAITGDPEFLLPFLALVFISMLW